MRTRPATPPAAPDPAQIERQTQLLIDLSEIGMKGLRALRIEDHTSIDDVLKISLNLERIGKAIRQIIVLETEIAEGRLAELLRAQADRQPVKVREDLSESSEDPSLPESLLDDLDMDDLDEEDDLDDLDEEDDLDDLDEEEEDLTVEGRCFGEMIQVLCQALDIPVPHERLHPEDWVVEAPAPHAPAQAPAPAWTRPRARRSIMPAPRPPSGRPSN